METKVKNQAKQEIFFVEPTCFENSVMETE